MLIFVFYYFNYNWELPFCLLIYDGIYDYY